ncbi:MAG TPA: hypothetical protein VGN63_21205 [Flavisolibacter sp.]|jgi:hypothetical protein|nr:hypothetical protein [Flavisolibacter sp.]
MRFLLATLLTAAFSFIAGIYLPWWSLAIVAFMVALLIQQKVGWAFLAAFTAIFLLWGGLSLLIHMRNQGVLTKRMAELFPLQGQSFYLILLTALIGALVAGFAAMSGSSLRPVLNTRRVR